MILELIRRAAGREPGVRPSDGRATPPPLSQETVRASVGDMASYTGSEPLWDAQARLASSGFGDGGKQMPGAGMDYGNRIMRNIELQVFSESAAYINQPNENIAGTDIMRLEHEICQNWLVDLQQDLEIAPGTRQDVSQWEAVNYGRYERARFAPMTIGVLHNGFKFDLRDVIVGRDELVPNYDSGFTLFTLLHVQHPDSSRVSPWRLVGMKPYAV